MLFEVKMFPLGENSTVGDNVSGCHPTRRRNPAL
jgi:hypothetical protein